MFTKDAKTRDINKELSQVLKERNKKKSRESIELTSSDDEITTTKSLKSPKSPLSSRSSLLSGKSPRDDTAAFFGSTKKPSGKMPNITSTFSDSEDEKSQGSNYFTRQKNDALYSPKSEKSDASKKNRLNQNANEKYISPRNEKQSLISTLKKPLNDTNIKFHKTKLPDTLEESPRSTSHTSPKSSILSRKEIESERTSLFKSPRNQMGNKISNQDSLIKENKKHYGENDDDFLISRNKNNQTSLLLKERSKSPKSPRTSSSLSPKGDSERRFGKHEKHHEKKTEKNEHVERSSRHSSPFEELDESSKREFDKNSSLLHGLLSKSDENINENSKESTNLLRKEDKEKSVNKDELTLDKKVQEPQQILQKNVFNDEVNETADDFNITEKLKRERQEKNKQRLAKNKNQSENTKLFEEAIEKVQYTNEDNQRLNSLKDKISKIDYPTKPSLDEKKVVTERAPRPTRSTAKTESTIRTRSLSASGRNNRYAHVQSKIVTRLPSSARNGLNDTDFNISTVEQDNQNLNDSTTIRQRTYAEWYTKKLSEAQFSTKAAREKLKSEEEKKTIELINKLKKSQLVFQAWESKKIETIKEENKKNKVLLKKLEEEELKKREKEKYSKTAFETWKKEKDKEERKKMKELLQATKALQDAEKDKKKRKAEAKKALEAWEKRKDEESKRSLSELQDRLKSSQDLSKTTKERQKLCEKAFKEWLEKKEEQIFNETNDLSMSKKHSRSSSTVNADLPPFYPSSRTIPFGR